MGGAASNGGVALFVGLLMRFTVCGRWVFAL
jgi:hypothetical protein